MLTDEQLIEQIRSQLRVELGGLNPPPGFLDRLPEPSMRHRRWPRRPLAPRPMAGRHWRIPNLSGMVAGVSVVLSIAVAVVAITALRAGHSTHHVTPGPSAVSSPGHGSSAAAVIKDCLAHGRLTDRFSRAQIEQALRTIPHNVKKYTDCPHVLNQALQTDRQSDTAQAAELYAPVAAFNRSTTTAQKALIQSASKADARRTDACQAPYQKQLFSELKSGSDRYKLYTLYEHGGLMEQYQSRVSVVAPQLAVLAQSWASLRLSSPNLQIFAHAMAAELYASLRAPKFDACAFVHDIARHHFSFAWARASSYGTMARNFWSELSTAGNRTGPFWRYVQSKGVESKHLFTKAQLTELANLPGEIG